MQRAFVFLRAVPFIVAAMSPRSLIHVVACSLLALSLCGCAASTTRFGVPLAKPSTPPRSVTSLVGGERDITIAGTIADVCTVKGCWMEATDDNGTPIFVRFRGYSYFVPRNAAGSRFVARGDAIVTTVSVEQLRHYAEDAKATPAEIAAITVPRRRIEFIADAVWIEGKSLDAPYRE